MNENTEAGHNGRCPVRLKVVACITLKYNNKLEAYRSGHNGTDSKSVVLFWGTVGSNPTASAKPCQKVGFIFLRWYLVLCTCHFVARTHLSVAGVSLLHASIHAPLLRYFVHYESHRFRQTLPKGGVYFFVVVVNNILKFWWDMVKWWYGHECQYC